METEQDLLDQIATAFAYNVIGSIFASNREVTQTRRKAMTRDEVEGLLAATSQELVRAFESGEAFGLIADIDLFPHPKNEHAVLLEMTAATGERRRYVLAATATPV